MTCGHWENSLAWRIDWLALLTGSDQVTDWFRPSWQNRQVQSTCGLLVTWPACWWRGIHGTLIPWPGSDLSWSSHPSFGIRGFDPILWPQDARGVLSWRFSIPYWPWFPADRISQGRVSSQLSISALQHSSPANVWKEDAPFQTRLRGKRDPPGSNIRYKRDKKGIPVWLPLCCKVHQVDPLCC